MALAGLGRAVAIAGEPGRPVRAKARDADGDKDSYSPPVSSAPSAPIQVRPPLLRTFSGLRMGGRLCLGVRPPGQKPAEEPGKRSAEQYNPAWLLLRDHLPTCSRPLFGPRANPHPKTPWSSSGNRTQKLVGDRFHVLHVRLSQLPILGSVPCHSRCPCPQSPRREGGGRESGVLGDPR